MSLPDAKWLSNFYVFRRLRADGIDTPDHFSVNLDERNVSVWITEQNHLRNDLRSNKIQDDMIEAAAREKIRVLEAIPNFPWNMPRLNNFELQVNAIFDYYNQHGHCKIPQSTPNGLSSFVSRLRMDYKHFVDGKEAKLNAQLVGRLESIGFEWSVRESPDEVWEKKYNMLKAFKEKHGHCDVPKSSADDMEMITLGRWVSKQREARRHGKILPERFAKLESIGFKWSLKKTM